MRTRIALLFALLPLATLGATCKGNGRSDAPSPPVAAEAPPNPAAEEAAARPTITDIDGLDIGVIRPELRADFFRVLNENFCYCGCPRTIASCLAARQDCTCVRCSERMANFILEQYKNGLSTEEVELELIDGFQEGYNGPKQEFDLANRPSKGNASAKNVLVEFADFRCAHCKAAFAPLNQLIESDPDVRLVYFYYPLGAAGDGPGVLASEAAEEARAQGKFWELAELLFKYQHALEEENLVKYAEEAGLDVPRFKNALAKHIHRERVLADKKIGQAVNVEATPTIFVNGRPFGLGRTLENFKLRLEIEAERGRCD